MQTSLSHEDEAQTNEAVAMNPQKVATVTTITVLGTLVDLTHQVLHDICDEDSKVQTLEEAKKGLGYLLEGIHKGSKVIEQVVTEFEMSQRTNAPATSSLN